MEEGKGAEGKRGKRQRGIDRGDRHRKRNGEKQTQGKKQRGRDMR